MIYVDKARCTGCAACMGLCPTGAIAIEDGVAVIAEALCSRCGDCLEACPQGAIILVETVSKGALQRLSEPATDLSELRPRYTRPNLREQLAPAAQAALVWAGRELLPRLANLALGWIDQQSAERSPGFASSGNFDRSTRRASSTSQARNGKRRRERRRQGRRNR